MVFVLLGLCVPPLVGVVVWVLNVMPVRPTAPSVLIDVGVAWTAALSILLLVPADIADTIGRCALSPANDGSCDAPGSAKAFLQTAWQCLYWYTFVAMITILPFHQEYADCGEFTVWGKVKWSVRQNFTFLVSMSIAGVVGILILLASHRLSVGSILGFAIAASNALGLTLVLFLLGYGLVEIPRDLWRKGSRGGRQRLLMHKVGVQAALTKRTHTKLAAAIATVGEVSRHLGPRDPLRKYVSKKEHARTHARIHPCFPFLSLPSPSFPSLPLASFV